ncbi:MAG: glycosyltransferase, partial [Candidatus Omnitrophica bacterium]|nr:glycosyltransferase [Candidatus Omnitrophota bacterium]
AKKSDFGFKEDDFILGNVSRLDHLKGQEVLILAMPKILERIPKAKLILIGEGKAKISLEKKIKELGLNKSVFLLGALKDVRVALKIMDVFCFLTFYEGFGLALLEAMAMRLPIIASYIPELEFILDKAGILIPPKKPEILAEKVFDLYNNPRKRTELANLAYARAKDFSYRNTVKDTLEIYKLAKQKWLRKKS